MKNDMIKLRKKEKLDTKEKLKIFTQQ